MVQKRSIWERKVTHIENTTVGAPPKTGEMICLAFENGGNPNSRLSKESGTHFWEETPPEADSAFKGCPRCAAIQTCRKSIQRSAH